MVGLNDWDFNRLLGQQGRQFNQALGWGQQREAAGLTNLETLAGRAGMPLGYGGYGSLPGGGQLGGTKQLLRLAQAQQTLVPEVSGMGMGGAGGGRPSRTPEEIERDRLNNQLLFQQAQQGWDAMRNAGGMRASPLDPREQLALNQATVANRNLFNDPNRSIKGGDFWVNRGKGPTMLAPQGRSNGNPYGMGAAQGLKAMPLRTTQRQGAQNPAQTNTMAKTVKSLVDKVNAPRRSPKTWIGGDMALAEYSALQTDEAERRKALETLKLLGG